MKRVADEVTDDWLRSKLKRHGWLRGVLIVVSVVTTLGVSATAIAGASVVAFCSQVDCGFWSTPSEQPSEPTCSYEWPPDGWHLREKVIGTLSCEEGVPLYRTVILVEPPVVNGVHLSRYAVYRIYARSDGTYFSEVVAGTPNPDDDGLTFIACIVAVTEGSMLDVHSYWASTDRSGIPVRPLVEVEYDCRRLIHDPTVLDE